MAVGRHPSSTPTSPTLGTTFVVGPGSAMKRRSVGSRRDVQVSLFILRIQPVDATPLRLHSSEECCIDGLNPQSQIAILGAFAGCLLYL